MAGSVIEYCIRNLSFFAMLTFPWLAIHCFLDDRVTVTKKKLLLIPAAFIVKNLDRIADGDFITGISAILLMSLLPVTGGRMPLFSRLVNWLRYIFIVIFSFMFLFTLVSLTGIVLSSFGITMGTEDAPGNIYSSEVLTIGTLLVMIPLILYLRLGYIRKHRSLMLLRSDRLFLAMYGLFLSSLSFMAINDQFKPLAEGSAFTAVIVPVCILLLMIYIPAFIAANRQRIVFERLADHQNGFLEAELKASRQYRESQEETRAFRHDVQNNLTALALLLEQERYGEAKDYVRDMRNVVDALSPAVVTGDDMLDPLLSSKLPEMKKNGIAFRLDGIIDGGLGWKPMDICTFFANALDNAIEAAQKTPEGMEKYIELSFRKTDKQRLISLANSCDGDVDCNALVNSSHYTSKTDRELHGYGVKNILRTAEKYGGIVRFRCKDCRFVLDMILSRQPENTPIHRKGQ